MNFVTFPRNVENDFQQHGESQLSPLFGPEVGRRHDLMSCPGFAHNRREIREDALAQSCISLVGGYRHITEIGRERFIRLKTENPRWVTD